MFEWGLALLQACVSKGSPASLPSPAPGCLPHPGQAAAQDTHTQKPRSQAHPLTCWQGQRSLLLISIFDLCSSQQNVSIVLFQVHCSVAGPSYCSTTSTKASARPQPQQQQQRKLQQFWLFK